ncbi:MAG: hypothetical protein MI757_08645, partial [Pirellulales bacterium]|nr:hypothetical protein [Pirellulales bacterium]
MQTNLLFPTLALLATTAFWPDFASAEMRQWTNAEGTRHLEAEFVEFTEGKVALRKSDGVVVRMPLEALSIRDRNFIRNIGKTVDKGPIKPKDPIKSKKKKLVGGTAIRKVLARKLKLNYQEVPLGEMLGDLKERIGVEIVVDGNSLSDAGVPFATAVSMNTTGMTVGTALQAALNKVGASWTIRHEVLMVIAKTQDDGLVPVVYKIIQPVP